MRTKIAVAGTAAGVTAAVLLLGGILAETEPAPAGSPARARVADRTAEQLQLGFRSGDTDALVRELQTRVGREPKNADAFVLLGLAYQQRARETANPAFLSSSEAALRRATALDATNPEALSALGSLELSRHEFRRALVFGHRAVALAPKSARHRGVVGDALVELGRYDEAFVEFDRMVRLKPGIASYSRVAYGRELLGRTQGAVNAMRFALGTTGGRGEPAAWVRVELGKLELGRGRLDAAERELRAALDAFPGYVFALEALARVAHARRESEEALGLARQAAQAVPLPQFVATLADLLAADGRKQEASEQVAVLGAIERLLRSAGVRSDLETALFDVDHGRRLSAALAAARRAHRERPSIEADDVLGWALVRNGRCAEGLRYAQRSLRLGTRDALKLFHRGMAERCLGRGDAARRSFRAALAINPHFSIRWSPVARRHASR